MLDKIIILFDRRMLHIRCSVHTNILPGVYFECQVRAGERGQGRFNCFENSAFLSLFENWRTLLSQCFSQVLPCKQYLNWIHITCPQCAHDMQYATNCASPWTFCFPSFTNLNLEYLVELKILSFLVRKLSASDHFVIVSLTWKGRDRPLWW